MKTLYYGGTIITMEKELYAEAVLVEDGKILAVGKKEALEVDNGACERVDLQGKVMLPAFMDAHSHFTQVAFSMLQVSLNELCTADEIREKIQQFMKENKIAAGEWLIARDYDNNNFRDGKNVSLETLDSFSPDNPLVIHHKSGHMGLFNSLALEKLGITIETKAPKGGKIERDENGLTGYLEENAFFDYLKKVPMPPNEELINAYKKAQEKYISYGIATIQEGMFTREMFPLYQLLLSADLLKLDLIVYPDTASYPAAKECFSEYLKSKESHLKIGGIKIFLDGSPQGRTAWMRKPYEGESDYCGYGTMTDEEVVKVFELAGKEDLQVIAHCNGDAAAEQFLRCLKKVSKEYPNLLKKRFVIIHGQLMGRDQLLLASELGVMVSFFTAHTYYWGDVHLKNFGVERAGRISPAASAIKCNLSFTFHQDAPVIEPNMLETVWCAVNRKTKAGICLGADERISVLEALKAITKNSAYQYFEEESCGSIAAGKNADFVILDTNPLAVPKEEIKDIRVLSTIKNGEVLAGEK